MSSWKSTTSLSTSSQRRRGIAGRRPRKTTSRRHRSWRRSSRVSRRPSFSKLRTRRPWRRATKHWTRSSRNWGLASLKRGTGSTRAKNSSQWLSKKPRRSHKARGSSLSCPYRSRRRSIQASGTSCILSWARIERKRTTFPWQRSR